MKATLADFDHAIDLSGVIDDLKNATGTPIFMAFDVIRPRPIPIGFIERGVGRYIYTDVRNATQSVPSNNKKYSNVYEKEFWDEFYLRKVKDLKWVDSEFTHGAVHDAESVFWICLLFFNRMWPQGKTVKESELPKLKRARGSAFVSLLKRSDNKDSRTFVKSLPTDGFEENFLGMLKTIDDYLREPWYSVSSTGRGEAYDFHLHDFMQRLFLKEIDALRNSDILLDECPLPVVVNGRSSGNAFASFFRLSEPNGMIAVKRGMEQTGDPSSRSKRRKTSEQADIALSEADAGEGSERGICQTEDSNENKLVKPTPSLTKVLSSPEESAFSEAAWDLLYEKEIETLWFKCDNN